MTVIVNLNVQVSLEKVQGKFVSKDEIIEQIQQEMEASIPGSIYVDDSEYEVTDQSIEAL